MNVSNADTQVAAARSSALVVPAPSLGVIAVTGSDRKAWLNGLVTCDLAPLRPGDAIYGLAVAQKGRILADLTFVLDEERILVVLPRSEAAVVRAGFEHYLIMEDAELGQDDDSLAVYFAHGPRSADVLAVARKENACGGLLDRTGLGGAVIVVPKAGESHLLARLAEIATLGDDAGWDALRIERGVPRFGVDFDTTMYPHEASLEKVAVSFSKGCYLGQEVVCMLEMRGHVKRKLVPIVLGAGSVPERGAPVTDARGERIGEVMSATQASTLGVPVALAMIKYAHAIPGRELTVGGVLAKVAENAS